MLFTNIILAGLSAVATAAPALVDRQVTTEVTPWEITAVNAGRPSGRPGNNKTTLRIKLSNPNQVKLQRVPRGYTYFPSFVATCDWSWPLGGEVPYGIETVCTPTEPGSMYGNLTMKLSPGDDGASPPRDFNVDITEFRTVTVFQQEYIRIWEGAAKFKLGDNLQQVCGGSGFCSLFLKNSPVLVKQELTKSVGSCEESTVGGC